MHLPLCSNSEELFCKVQGCIYHNSKKEESLANLVNDWCFAKPNSLLIINLY